MTVGLRIVAAAFIWFGLFGHDWLAVQQRIDPKAGCRQNPAIVDRCFPIHGRLFASNGSPGVRIWPVGTKRILGVMPSEAEIVPDVVRKNINWDARLYGDFEVCPFTRETPGTMRLVCVESATNLVGERFVEGQSVPVIFRIRR
jgi:hypothetical protein